MLGKTPLKNAINQIGDDFADIAKNYADDIVHSEFTTAILTDKAQAPIKGVIPHIISYADDVIMCGMGGELIARIVEECRFINENTHFILQPMTKADFLRKHLYGAGFELLEERAAEDSGKIYTVMLWRFSGVSREIDEITALCGKNRDRRYLGKIAEKLLKNAVNMEKSAEHSERAAKLRKTAEKILLRIENENQ